MACGNDFAPCTQPAGSVGPDCQPAQTVDGYVLCIGRSECKVGAGTLQAVTQCDSLWLQHFHHVERHDILSFGILADGAYMADGAGFCVALAFALCAGIPPVFALQVVVDYSVRICSGVGAGAVVSDTILVTNVQSFQLSIRFVEILHVRIVLLVRSCSREAWWSCNK